MAACAGMRVGLREHDARHGAFSVAQALESYSRHEIRTMVRSGKWARLHKGVLCEATKAHCLLTRLAAAGLAVGRPVTACLASAAELHGFGVVTTDRLHVVDPGGHLSTRDRLVLHQLEVAPDETVLLAGLPTTSPARTAIELARRLDRARGLAVLDAALRQAAVTPDDLHEQCERQAGRRGIRQARWLVPLADGRAESPMESTTRLICRMAGLPAPELQYPVRDEFGWPCRYLDLAWPERKVAVEYDGVEAHAGAVALRRDRARHNFLVEHGWTVIYATADDVFHHPERLVRRIARALNRPG